MDTLESYIASDYLAVQQDVVEVNQLLIDVALTFSKTFKDNTWPYEYKVRTNGSTSEAPPSQDTQSGSVDKASQSEKDDISQGTQAMVLIASGRMLGNCTLPNGGYSKSNLPTPEDLTSKWKSALQKLINNLTKTKKVKSSFGNNNPITFSHITELSKLLKKSTFENEKGNLLKDIPSAENKLKKAFNNIGSKTDLLNPGKNWRYHPNAFVPLRAVRAAIDLDSDQFKNLNQHQSFFESALHDQLSFSSIPDSRFDPAELAFCLEGLLLCAPEAVDPSLFERVLEVLAEKQNTSAHWRPNKPFIANSKGQITLPISVEVANSLLRSVAIMDEGRFYNTFTAKSLPLLKRFWQWLRARSVRFEIHGQQCIGWHSEHVNDPTVIHIWDTSQVAEFMIYFKEMLERHIATTTLRLSRLDVKRFELKKKSDEASKTPDKR